jgi:hypothetical protein
MKPCLFFGLGLVLITASLPVIGRETASNYKFTAGTTNVFTVEITVRSETGSEVTTGNVFLVTKEATTNSARLSCRGNFKSDMKRPMSRGPGYYGGYYPGGMMQNMNIFPNDCEIELDMSGHEIRDGGDYVLSVPLGKLVQSLFPTLPAKSSVETSDAVVVLDDPFWLGPADCFLNASANGQPMRMRSYMMSYPQQNIATLMLSRHTESRLLSGAADALNWQQKSALKSFTQTGNEPRLVASSESSFSFDRNTGMVAKIETQADVTSQTETTSRKAKVSFKSRLLTGDELVAALVPPPPPAPPRKLSGADLDKIIADLKSPELETRRSAMRQLNGANIDSPSPELISLVTGMALDSDQFVRMSAANFLGNYATTNEVPVLIKLAKDSDWNARSSAIKALGKLKDERAIQPLADQIARGSSMYGQDASAALINIGAPAEKAVLGLLAEHNLETQRQACNILQQIGTAESLEPLQKLAGDSDQSISQAATEAIRMIKLRQ